MMVASYDFLKIVCILSSKGATTLAGGGGGGGGGHFVPL